MGKARASAASFHALQRRHGAGVMACSEQSVCWLRVHERVSKGGERRKKIKMMTTEHARSNLCGAHGCMRLWVAVPKMPHAARDAHAHEQTDSCAFGWTNADEVGAREEGTCLSAHCDT
jgi:hypothetical protein